MLIVEKTNDNVAHGDSTICVSISGTTPTYLGVCKVFPDRGGIARTHLRGVMSFAQAGNGIALLGTAQFPAYAK